MRAFYIERYGKADRVVSGALRDPEVRDDDVLIQIHAASVNPVDSKIRNGDFKAFLPFKMPLILGNDLAGIVVRVGSRVRQFRPGDEVFAQPDTQRAGAFAEFIAVSERYVAHKPKKLSMEEAASLPLVGLTAWQVLVEKARVQRGQKVLIHAGSGGVGVVAIQLAKHLGAHVATTTSTANVDFVKRLGADVVVDYKTQDFSTVLRDYDVVLDPLGGETQSKSVGVLKAGGKLIGIAGPPDPAFASELGANAVIKLVMTLLSRKIRKNAGKRGVYYAFHFMKANGEQLRKIGDLADSGVIKPVIDRVFPFDDTKEAIAYVERGRSKGKVIVKLK